MCSTETPPRVPYGAPTTRSVCVHDLGVRGSAPDLASYYDSGGLVRRVWRKLPLGLTPVLGHPLSSWFC